MRFWPRATGSLPTDLMPWHYHDPFFQRTPLVYELDLDQYYKGRDIEELARKYYASVGLPIDDILARSDLYDREGKYPHAFSHDVDRQRRRPRPGQPAGHRAVDGDPPARGGPRGLQQVSRPSEPWLLREPAHSFTTEAIAMFFGRLSRNAAWMQTDAGPLRRGNGQDQDTSATATCNSSRCSSSAGRW